jgi:hypothetical protein
VMMSVSGRRCLCYSSRISAQCEVTEHNDAHCELVLTSSTSMSSGNNEYRPSAHGTK